jgi:hypothetical protein
MKNSDSPLDRLLRAAATQPIRPAVAEEPPFGFTTRVVSGWLAGCRAEGAGPEAKMQALWFRRAALCALAVMAITVGWSFKIDTAPNDEMAIAAYDATADLP